MTPWPHADGHETSSADLEPLRRLDDLISDLFFALPTRPTKLIDSNKWSGIVSISMPGAWRDTGHKGLMPGVIVDFNLGTVSWSHAQSSGL